MPSRRSLLTLALCVVVTIAIVAPAAAQLKMPPDETVAFLKKTLTADAAKFNRHVADVATEITSMGKFAAFDDLVNSIGASTARSKQDEVVAAVLPGLNKAAADGLQLGPKSFLAVALAARARKPLNAAKVNELVFALAEKSKVQALDKYEKAALVEILEWRKAGMAVVDGKIVSTAAAARTEAAAASIVKTVRSELDAASVGRLQELLPAKNGYTTATAKDFFVDAERLGTADNNIYDCFRVAKVSAPANSVYESRLTAIANMMKSGKHSTDQEADAFAKVIYNVFQKSKAGKSPLSAAENELLEAAPKYFHIIDSANAEAVAFLKRIPIASSSNLAPGVGRAAEASSKWPVITVPTSIPRAAARNARAEIDKAIRDAGSRAWSRMSMPKGPERGVGAKPDMFRLWTKSKNTIDTYSTLDAFKAYSKKVPSGPLALERETSSIAYSAHNYQVIMADYIRSGKPVAFDDLTTMARAIKTKVEKYNGVLSPYDKEFLTAYGELVDSIGKTRFVWRDGMVLTSEESTELYTIAKALHDRKFTTYEQYSSAMSDTQAAMMKEISYFGKPKAVPASVDFEQVIRRPGESNVSLIDVINADRQWLTASDNAARAADANKPLTRLKNWITTGSQYLP